jgi:hypothetical protein
MRMLVGGEAGSDGREVATLSGADTGAVPGSGVLEPAEKAMVAAVAARQVTKPAAAIRYRGEYDDRVTGAAPVW